MTVRLAMLVGHSQVRGSLESDWPAVVLLWGPAGVGKRALAHHVARHHGTKTHSLLELPHSRQSQAEEPGLQMWESEEVVRFAGRRPMQGFKVVILDLEAAREDALNSLLKVLEEPPPGIRFILTTSRRPLLTVQSRAAVYRVGYLTDEEVETVLISQGWNSIDARRAAAQSGGTLVGASAWKVRETAKGPVLTMLRAVASGEEDLLQNALTAADEEQVAVLRTFCLEALTGRWRLFTEQESFGLERHVRTLRRMHAQLTRPARPAVALRTALPLALEEIRG